MSYSKERDEFIARATGEGLSLDVVRKLLRYASTLQRLAVAQCNGDYPFNGDRDRPSMTFRTCEHCNATGTVKPRVHKGANNSRVYNIDTLKWEWGVCNCANHNGVRFDDCLDCQGTGKLQTNGKERMRYDARYTVCPKCETSGVSKGAMVTSTTEWDNVGDWQANQTKHRRVKVCPDCRTAELVRELLKTASIAQSFNENKFAAVFGGDPRGAVLRLSTPNWPYDKSGRGGAYGLYVPARER